MVRKLMLLGTIAAGLGLPASAGAVGTGTLDSVKLPDAANSIAAGPDGSVFVTLTATRKVAKVAADGTVTESADLGGAPGGIAFAEGRVWATVTALKKVAAIDPANLSSIRLTDTPANRCGPVAVAGPGNGKVFVSLPNDGTGATCSPATPSALLPVAAATGTADLWVDDRGQAFDLLAANGKLWVPDFEGGAVRRLAANAALTVEATYGLPVGGQAQGVGVAPDGQIVATAWGANSVARIAPSAPNGAMNVFATSVPSPVGAASVGGSLYVAASAFGGGGSASLHRFPADGSVAEPITPLAGSAPWRAAPGPDGTVLFTDLNEARLLRYTSRPPRATTGVVSENTGLSAKVELSANPGGNPAEVTVQFGTTTVYGSTAAAVPVQPGATASGTADLALRADLPGLALGTTYHYRAVAATAEGIAYGEDRTFTTPAKPTGPGAGARPQLPLTRSTKKGVLKVTKIRVAGLLGGETIKVTCAGKGCPSKKKDRAVTATAKQAGDLTLAAKKITAAKLGKGAKVTVQVTKPGTTGVVTTAKVTKKKKFDVQERCLADGAKTPSKCAG